MTRTINALNNFKWSTISTIANVLLNFLLRTIFIYKLGNEFLGLNGLFTDVLTILSLVELGVGNAIGYKLYKPLAEDNKNEIKTIMHYYKRVYIVISFVVLILGILLLPFLNNIVKEEIVGVNIYIVYVIFLLNTVFSYLFTYKFTLLHADQKTYIQTKYNIIFAMILTITQILILYFISSYYIYILSNLVINVIKYIAINEKIDVLYPYVNEECDSEISDTDKAEIITKTKALMLHKIGDVCINQTDNVITSAYIDIGTVGIVSNYTLISGTLNMFINSIFSACIAGFGNYLVTESNDKSFELFELYEFLAYIIYGFVSVELYFLSSHFIQIWLGERYILDNGIIILICINYYLSGLRVPLGYMKQAAGSFERDKLSPIIQAIVNLVISIYLVKKMGLIGVYIGTVVSSLIPNLWRPIIVYRYIFNKNIKKYFINYISRIFIIALVSLVSHYVLVIINFEINFITFVAKGLIILIIYIVVIFLTNIRNNFLKRITILIRGVLR